MAKQRVNQRVNSATNVSVPILLRKSVQLLSGYCSTETEKRSAADPW